MVEYESHSVAVAVDLADAPAEGGDQIVHRLKQYVGQHGSFQVSPQPLDQVQTRTVRRQPVDFDLIAVLGEPQPNSLGAMAESV